MWLGLHTAMYNYDSSLTFWPLWCWPTVASFQVQSWRWTAPHMHCTPAPCPQSPARPPGHHPLHWEEEDTTVTSCLYVMHIVRSIADIHDPKRHIIPPGSYTEVIDQPTILYIYYILQWVYNRRTFCQIMFGKTTPFLPKCLSRIYRTTSLVLMVAQSPYYVDFGFKLHTQGR